MSGRLVLSISTSLLLAAASLPCEAFAQGSSRTVRIASVNWEDGEVASVELSVSAGEEAVSLYALHGASDKGSDMGAWDSVDFVCEVPADAGERPVIYAVSQPRDAAYRFALGSFDVPFKKQLARLTSTGTQYFILGDKCPNQDWRVAADVEFVKISDTVGFWGARKAARDSSFLSLCQGNNTLRFDTAAGTPTYSGTAGRRYQIDQSNQGVSIAWDGGSANVSVSDAAFTSPCPMGLFAVNSNGSPTALTPGKMSVHGFKVWTNRTDETSLIYDLVPCVRNDDTVTFYNSVDGSFLSPAAGAFTYDEADVVPTTAGDQTVDSITDALAEDKRILSSTIQRGGGSLAATLSVTPGLASNTVMVAYGALDCGENPAHWDNCTVLGTVAADATSFSSALPFAKWSEDVARARFFLARTAGLVEAPCLISSGTQYVITDYTATGRTKIEARAAFVDAEGTHTVLWSGRAAASSKAFGLMSELLSGNRNIRVDYDSRQSRPVAAPAAGSTALHTLSMTGAATTLDGNSYSQAGATDFTAGAPLTFFAINTAGTISYISTAAIAEVKVWADYEDETSLVMHLKPAVENGVCGFRNVLDGGRFYPNSAESDDDFEVAFPGLHVASVSDARKGESGLTIFVR